MRPARPGSPGRLLRQVSHQAQVLFTRSEAQPRRRLARRLAFVLILFGAVVALFWFDRDGLVDHYDGDVSFADVVYFAMVTITTVGYGDIVPVTDKARLIDALLVTPVRLVLWLVFLGTAYEFVVQKIVEEWRMRKIRERLEDHVIICGFGHSGQTAAEQLVARGRPAEEIVVIDLSEATVHAAAAAGFVGLRGDCSKEQMLLDAGLERAGSILLCTGRDDTNVLVALTVRNLSRSVRIISAVHRAENLKLVRQAGADVAVVPSRLGGYLLADAVSNRFTAEYVLDLLTSDGRVTLEERPAAAAEIGKHMRDVADGLVVRAYRKGEPIGFWEAQRDTIQAGDVLLVIKPNPAGSEAETKPAE